MEPRGGPVAALSGASKAVDMRGAPPATIILVVLVLPVLAGCLSPGGSDVGPERDNLPKRTPATQDISRTPKPVLTQAAPGAIDAAPLIGPGGVAIYGRTTDARIEVHTTDGWHAPFWSGINLGATVPGKQPGEFGPTYDDFSRWFEMMRTANVEVVRIYTVLPPAFYQAFADHNAGHPYEPLWLLQGIWSPEEELIGDGIRGKDAFDPEITHIFEDRIEQAVRVVHGDIVLPPRRGFASGTYDQDVSNRLLGWVVGTEWFQFAVKTTNDAHPLMAPYQGTYFSAAATATPFDSWLASMLDHTAIISADYGTQHPMSFTNWVTTDPLRHANEPLPLDGSPDPHEDLVSVDPSNVRPTGQWHAGYFSLYHVYPYYPDFLRYEPAYQEYRTSDGTIDPYAGYLRALADAHPGIPLVIGEYGLPSSRGMAHLGPLGRDQGMHNEQEQADHFEAMYRAIVAEGYAGALVFEWADEWFKGTWNTQGLELPRERRSLWRNMLTNEEHFGAIAMEPGATAQDTILLDGSFDDWNGRKARAIHEAPDIEVRISHDEAYLYVIMRRTAGDWDALPGDVWLGVDVLPEGTHRVDEVNWHVFESSPETVFSLGAQGTAWIRAPYDVFTWQYHRAFNYAAFDPAWADPSTTTLLPWNLPLNRPLLLPETGQAIPFEFFEVGKLQHGPKATSNAEGNPLVDWYREAQAIEMRIPWTMIGFTDPSSRQVWDWPHEAGAIVPRTTDGVRLEVTWKDQTGAHATIPIDYSWDIWNVVQYHERPKELYWRMQGVYGEGD